VVVVWRPNVSEVAQPVAVLLLACIGAVAVAAGPLEAMEGLEDLEGEEGKKDVEELEWQGGMGPTVEAEVELEYYPFHIYPSRDALALSQILSSCHRYRYRWY
jgi:hypothetical protein